MTALSSEVVSEIDSSSFVRSEDLLRVDALQGVTRSIHVAYGRAWKLWVEYKTLGPAARDAIEVWRFPLSAYLAAVHVLTTISETCRSSGQF